MVCFACKKRSDTSDGGIYLGNYLSIFEGYNGAREFKKDVRQNRVVLFCLAQVGSYKI